MLAVIYALKHVEQHIHLALKNPDYLGLKTQTLPDHSLKNAKWAAT